MRSRRLLMILSYYIAMAILGTILSIIYVFIWHKRFDVNITAFFLLMPIVNAAHLLSHCDPDTGTVILALKIIYFGGDFLPWLITLCVANLCKIEISRVVRVITFSVNLIMYGFILTIGYLPFFYKGITLEKSGSIYIMHKDYGPLHNVFYAVMVFYLAACFALIFYSYFKKKEVSKKLLALLFIPVAITMIGYFASHLFANGVDLMPFTFVVTGITYLFIARRISLYDVSDMVIETMVRYGNTGFILLDYRKRYLGSNETAKSIIPELRELTVDESIEKVPDLASTVTHWVKHFTESKSSNDNLYVKHGEDEGEDRIYIVKTSYLYDGRHRRGYQIFISDDTQNQKFIKLLDQYNSELEEEVSQKTERIERMHDNLILGMAAMVESRDNSTGGHIKRTSDCIRILTEEISKDNVLGLSSDFCRNLTKAAPMHDLGKIAVDDDILRKPGRFTPEEFDKMKLHAPEGALIVHEILKDTDDLMFKTIAENVAHYHHERMDGSGYPCGLHGEEIPIEARIMAIADVYDALVSKRVYKEKMSFEDADRIILEGMGSQFDPALRKYYEAARPKLEAYYRSHETA